MPEPAELAFKAYEIEELADLYFFRPVGIVFARAARAFKMTPTAVTLVSVVVGVIGGAMLYDNETALAGFALIMLYGVLDSSDGQLARMTGQTSELGRVLDGAGGYVVYMAIFSALVARQLDVGTAASAVGVAVLAAIATAVHAQLYDYHRTAYIRLAIEGRTDYGSESDETHGLTPLLRRYEAIQMRLAASHRDVEDAIRQRAIANTVRDDDRAWYRACFYLPVRGWNLMGDNTRFYALGILAWFHHLEWFFPFLLGPMNVALVTLWMWQARADRRFLAGAAAAARRPAGL